MTDFKNERLHDAFSKYANVALSLISKDIENGARPVRVRESSWKRTGRALFREDTLHPIWTISVHRLDNVLPDLPEYHECLRLLDEDPKIRPQINALVGTADSQMTLTAENLMTGFIADLLDEKGKPVFDVDVVDKRYGFVEDALYADLIVLEFLAPLLGLETEAPEIPLTENLAIAPLTPEEIKSCITMGLVRVGPPDNTVFNPPRHAVKCRLEEPKVVGVVEDEERNVEQVSKHFGEVADTITDVLEALRLFKPGQCYLSGVIRRPVNWLASYTGSGGAGRWSQFPVFAKYTLDEAEASDFKQLWETLRTPAVKRRGFLEAALARFGLAKERHVPEDQTIDLMIASEALFLCDVSEEQYRGELRYRLALRAGLFIGNTIDDQREIFRLMKAAYDARSAIVHGGKPKLPTGFGSLPEFANKIEECLRRALQKAIVLASRPGSSEFLIDWDELVFTRGAGERLEHKS